MKLTWIETWPDNKVWDISDLNISVTGKRGNMTQKDTENNNETDKKFVQQQQSPHVQRPY
jgi:hypothetical protein